MSQKSNSGFIARAKKITVSVYFLLLAIVAYPQTSMVWEDEITVIKEIKVFIEKDATVIFETRNLSANSDPVLNLFSPGAEEVASDDNSGAGVSAKISYLCPASGMYVLIIRSRANDKSGTADIYKNNILLSANAAFGGWHKTLANLRTRESVQTVKLPNGADGTHIMYILKENGIGIAGQTRGNSINNSVYYRNTGSNQDIKIVIGTSEKPGRSRLVRNDALIPNHDTDGDGLGYELENEIGTCIAQSGMAKNFSCLLCKDARDTDGDGLSDGNEFLGKSDADGGLPLPKWGANPRHKDMFIEVDYMRRTVQENVENIKEHMKVDVARQFVAIYADSLTTNPALRLRHAETLNNPDKEPGISVHLDIGVEPERPKDATMYGNWGGYTAVNAQDENGVPCTSATSEANCVGVKPNQPTWQANMSERRLGIFRYALGYTSGGGSCGYAFGCAFNFHDLRNPVHEWGHTFGLGHAGPMGAADPVDVNCKPNYPSIMNYAYLYNYNVGFSDGVGIPDLNNTDLNEWRAVTPVNKNYLDVLKDKFGYTVDYEFGHVDWNRDGVIQPMGRKVKAYANFQPHGSCEFTKYNRVKVGDAKTTTSPVLARLSNRIYIFYQRDGLLKYRYSTASWNCPVPDLDNPCLGGTWSAERTTGMNSVGVDVVRVGNLANGYLLVVSSTWPGKLIEKRLSLSGANENWSEVTTIPGTVSGEPALSSFRGTVYLAYKGSDLNIHYNRFTGNWGPDKIAVDANDMPIKTCAEWSFPALHTAYLPWKEAQKKLYGFFPGVDGKINVWHFMGNSEKWELTDVLEQTTDPIHGKPGVAYVPYKNSSEYPGRLYLLYMTRSTTPVYTGQVKFLMSYVKNETIGGITRKIEKIGIRSYFSNVWYKAYAASLFYEYGKDINLRAALSIPNEDENESFQVWFNPNADGINNLVYKNFDDWKILGQNLCKLVVNPGGLVSNPVRCD